MIEYFSNIIKYISIEYIKMIVMIIDCYLLILFCYLITSLITFAPNRYVIAPSLLCYFSLFILVVLFISSLPSYVVRFAHSFPFISRPPRHLVFDTIDSQHFISQLQLLRNWPHRIPHSKLPPNSKVFSTFAFLHFHLSSIKIKERGKEGRSLWG